MNQRPIWGMTSTEYAAFREIPLREARAEYSRLVRHEALAELPAPSRILEEDGSIKFCLPVFSADGVACESETVIIPMDGHHGNRWKTLCVSVQVGCRMGCAFCETGGMGLLANLCAEEITAQRLAARLIASSSTDAGPWTYFADGIRNIVFMGMGEPLDNYDEVVRAIRIFNDPAGFNFPLSQMTLSTAGHVEGLRRLAAEGLRNLRLSISLNAARDVLRDELMPINRIAPLADLQRALLEFPLPKKGRFLVGYVLLKDVNDSMEDADALAAWCRPFAATVNLIPYNSQRTARFAAPGDERLLAFMMRLKEKGCFVKRRVSRGQGLMAACGQLGGVSPRPVISPADRC